MPVELAPGVPLAPLSLAQYEQMVDVGVLGEDDRVELLDGLLIAVSLQGPSHGDTIMWVTDWAYDRIDRRRFGIRVQLPLRCLPASSPEPDIALVAARPLGTGAHPTGAALAIEVSVSSAALDLGVKRWVYARGGIEEYWVVRPVQGIIRVHRTPHHGDYTDVTEATEATFAGATLRLAGLTGPGPSA